MQPGARFAVERDLGYAINRDDDELRAGGLTLYIGNLGRTMDHAATDIFDVTCVVGAERFATVYDAPEQGGTVLLEAMASVEVSLVHAVPACTRRVAITEDRWYVASDAEVHVLARRTDPDLELIAVDALDIAASKSLLCVVEPRGLAWFDRDGRVHSRLALTSPTAVMYDALAGGWLVAVDGDVLQLATPSAAPTTFARGIGLAVRIRRDLDALYASTTDGELVEVTGIRNGPASTPARSIAAYAPGFTQFGAHFELFVDEGEGPRRFYHPVPCGCRTRRVEVLDKWSERRPDNACDFFERHRCPQCGREWDQGFAG